jgi:uncharacterized protein
MMIRHVFRTFVYTAFGLVFSVSAYSGEFVSIGTGGVTGLDFKIGQSVCTLVNNDKSGVRCSAVSSGGPIDNIMTLHKGEMNMGVVQSDLLFDAFHGKSKFRDKGAMKDLRAVLSLQPKAVTIIARRDSGIRQVGDLVGKRLNIGAQGSENQALWNFMWNAFGKTNSDLGVATELKSSELPDALCHNKIDAYFSLVSHPSSLAQETMKRWDVVVVSAKDAALSKCCRGGGKEAPPFLVNAVIPGGLYRGGPEDVETFGVRPSIVSSARTREETVYQVTKSVFDNLEKFRKMHPAFQNLKAQEMIEDTRTAPPHPGALRYFREKGWM